jgi:8-oxo-dGTP pyrophosphatase MutT (NUDIX family)
MQESSSRPETTLAGKPSRGTSISKKFHLKHVFRGGAVIWTKHQGKDYYVVFSSKSRPNRGIQLPGGRIERSENPAEAIIREAKEEVGIDTRIICPLGIIYFENEVDNYSSLQIYYLVRPVFPLNVNKKWKFIDKDHTHQELECWLEPVDKDPEFLAAGQRQVIVMFQKWLEEHKKPEEIENLEQIEHTDNFEGETDIFELN